MVGSGPRVLVTIPTFKRPHYLRETLQSVVEQTFTGWECIVFDNDPERTAAAVVEEFADARIRYHNNERNLGAFGNWNRCREAAIESGIRYWALLEDDNLWDTSFLQTAVESLDTHPESALYHSDKCSFVDNPRNAMRGVDVAWIRKDNKIAEYCPEETVCPMLCYAWFGISATMCRVDVIRMVEPFDLNCNLSADRIMLGRITMRYKIMSDPEPRMLYRVHDASVSQRFVEMGGRQRQQSYAKQVLLKLAIELGLVTPETFLEQTARFDAKLVAKTVLSWLRPDAPEEVQEFGRAALAVAGKRRKDWEHSTWEFRTMQLVGDWVMPHLPTLRRWACFILRRPDPEAEGNFDL